MNDGERLVELLKAKYDHYCDQCGVNKQTDYIENLAKYLIAHGVTVQKHGRWEDYVNIKGVVRCSECNDTYIYREWVDEGKWYYCPNCGAKMDLEVSDG